VSKSHVEDLLSDSKIYVRSRAVQRLKILAFLQCEKSFLRSIAWFEIIHFETDPNLMPRPPFGAGNLKSNSNIVIHGKGRILAHKIDTNDMLSSTAPKSTARPVGLLYHTPNMLHLFKLAVSRS
jgi:hypothetical protein